MFPLLCVVIAEVVPTPPMVAPLATVKGLRIEPVAVVKNVPPPSVTVPVPAFRSLSAMTTPSDSARLIPALPLVIAVTVVAASRRKFVVEPMPPDPAFKVTSSAVRSVPMLSAAVIAPLPLVVNVTSLPTFNENASNAMLLPLPVVRLIFVFAARVISALNVIVPLFALPMLIVPAVMRSSSASVRPRMPLVSNPPRSIPTLPSVACCRSDTVPAPTLIVALVGSMFMLSAISVTLAVPTLEVFTVEMEPNRLKPKLSVPAPAVPVIVMSPVADTVSLVDWTEAPSWMRTPSFCDEPTPPPPVPVSAMLPVPVDVTCAPE